MKFRDVVNAVGDSLKDTTLGALFGAGTGALSGSIGSAFIKSLGKHSDAHNVGDQTLATMTGSAFLGGVIGFVSSTPMSTEKVGELLRCCGPGVGYMGAPLFMGFEALSAVIGFEFLKEILDDLPLANVALDSGIGSIFTLGILVVLMMCSWCIPSNEPVDNYESASRNPVATSGATMVVIEESKAEAAEEKSEEKTDIIVPVTDVTEDNSNRLSM
jgi:amino acid transporter